MYVLFDQFIFLPLLEGGTENMVAINVNCPIYTGEGSSVEKDHPSSINMGRTMRRTIGVSFDLSRV